MGEGPGPVLLDGPLDGPLDGGLEKFRVAPGAQNLKDRLPPLILLPGTRGPLETGLATDRRPRLALAPASATLPGSATASPQASPRQQKYTLFEVTAKADLVDRTWHSDRDMQQSHDLGPLLALSRPTTRDLNGFTASLRRQRTERREPRPEPRRPCRKHRRQAAAPEENSQPRQQWLELCFDKTLDEVREGVDELEGKVDDDDLAREDAVSSDILESEIVELYDLLHGPATTVLERETQYVKKLEPTLTDTSIVAARGDETLRALRQLNLYRWLCGLPPVVVNEHLQTVTAMYVGLVQSRDDDTRDKVRQLSPKWQAGATRVRELLAGAHLRQLHVVRGEVSLLGAVKVGLTCAHMFQPLPLPHIAEPQPPVPGKGVARRPVEHRGVQLQSAPCPPEVQPFAVLLQDAAWFDLRARLPPEQGHGKFKVWGDELQAVALRRALLDPGLGQVALVRDADTAGLWLGGVRNGVTPSMGVVAAPGPSFQAGRKSVKHRRASVQLRKQDSHHSHHSHHTRSSSPAMSWTSHGRDIPWAQVPLGAEDAILPKAPASIPSKPLKPALSGVARRHVVCFPNPGLVPWELVDERMPWSIMPDAERYQPSQQMDLQVFRVDRSRRGCPRLGPALPLCYQYVDTASCGNAFCVVFLPDCDVLPGHCFEVVLSGMAGLSDAMHLFHEFVKIRRPGEYQPPRKKRVGESARPQAGRRPSKQLVDLSDLAPELSFLKKTKDLPKEEPLLNPDPIGSFQALLRGAFHLFPSQRPKPLSPVRGVTVKRQSKAVIERSSRNSRNSTIVTTDEVAALKAPSKQVGPEVIRHGQVGLLPRDRRVHPVAPFDRNATKLELELATNETYLSMESQLPVEVALFVDTMTIQGMVQIAHAARIFRFGDVCLVQLKVPFPGDFELRVFSHKPEGEVAHMESLQATVDSERGGLPNKDNKTTLEFAYTIKALESCHAYVPTAESPLLTCFGFPIQMPLALQLGVFLLSPTTYAMPFDQFRILVYVNRSASAGFLARQKDMAKAKFHEKHLALQKKACASLLAAGKKFQKQREIDERFKANPVGAAAKHMIDTVRRVTKENIELDLGIALKNMLTPCGKFAEMHRAVAVDVLLRSCVRPLKPWRNCPEIFESDFGLTERDIGTAVQVVVRFEDQPAQHVATLLVSDTNGHL